MLKGHWINHVKKRRSTFNKVFRAGKGECPDASSCLPVPFDCVRDAGTLRTPAPPSDRPGGDSPRPVGELGGRGVRSTGREVARSVGDLVAISIRSEPETSPLGGFSPSSSSPPERASVAAIQLDRAVFSRQRMSTLTGVLGTMPEHSVVDCQVISQEGAVLTSASATFWASHCLFVCGSFHRKCSWGFRADMCKSHIRCPTLGLTEPKGLAHLEH